MIDPHDPLPWDIEDPADRADAFFALYVVTLAARDEARGALRHLVLTVDLPKEVVERLTRLYPWCSTG